MCFILFKRFFEFLWNGKSYFSNNPCIYSKTTWIDLITWKNISFRFIRIKRLLFHYNLLKCLTHKRLYIRIPFQFYKRKNYEICCKICKTVFKSLVYYTGDVEMNISLENLLKLFIVEIVSKALKCTKSLQKIVIVTHN